MNLMKNLLPTGDFPKNNWLSRNHLFSEIEREFDNMYNRMFGKSYFNNLNDSGWPKVDTYTVDGFFFVEAHLPGIQAENITVELEEDILMISGVQEKRREDVEYGLRELKKSAFRRQFRLPNVDKQSCDATLKDGVLVIKYKLNDPELPNVEVKKIEVKTK